MIYCCIIFYACDLYTAYNCFILVRAEHGRIPVIAGHVLPILLCSLLEVWLYLLSCYTLRCGDCYTSCSYALFLALINICALFLDSTLFCV